MSEKLTALKRALEAASEDAQHWNTACDAVVDLFGATGAILVPATPHFRGMWMSCSQGLGKTVPEYIAGGWHLKDPREQVTALMIDRGVATDDDIFPDRATKEATPFYQQFLLRHDFGVLIAMRILTPNGYWGLMLHFANDHPPLSEAEKELISTVQPLFERAATQAELNAHKRIADFADFFRGTDSEVFIFDVDGEHCFTIDNHGAIRTHDQLTALLPDEMSDALGQELKEICLSDPGQSYSTAYQFHKDGRHHNVLVIQIPPALRHFFMPFKACAIRTDCSDASALKQRQLREVHGLSAAEITTVEMLATGQTPALIAGIIGLKPTTVRQRLKLIYDKTGVNSQVELIALYGRL